MSVQANGAPGGPEGVAADSPVATPASDPAAAAAAAAPPVVPVKRKLDAIDGINGDADADADTSMEDAEAPITNAAEPAVSQKKVIRDYFDVLQT